MKQSLKSLYFASVQMHEKLYSLAHKTELMGEIKLVKKLVVEGRRAEKLSIELGRLFLPPPNDPS